jgi:small-conductance mechanosensitive channel
MRFLPPPSFQACALPVLLAVLSLGISWPLSGDTQAQNPPSQLIDERQVLRHLNSVITWYRNTKSQVQPVGLPTDAIYQTTANKIAVNVVSLAFASAEKAAPLLPSENAEPGKATTHQKLLQMIQDTATHNAKVQAQISQLSSKIASARRNNVKALTDRRDQLQGELDLGNSMLNSLNQLANTTAVEKKPKTKNESANEPNSNGFEASVAQLKSSLPEIFDPKNQAPAPAPAQNISNPTGLIGQLRRLYDQSLSMRQIESLTLETNQLQELVNNMRQPLRAQLIATIQQGRSLTSAADNPQPGQAVPTKQDFDALASRFDLLAGIEVPLNQESAALNESKANLADWRTSLGRESGIVLRNVLIRVGIVVGVLGLLLLVSNLWKRATLRYISDARRRRQVLVVRRFVIGFFIGLVLIFSFVTEFSALATFAGFLTAGVAVGLQTILLSVAAYFFLIGRYGIRVGDRITIAGVTGDVVDVGFVRFYMLELDSTGIDLQPTGRIVTFPNAVLFQPTTPMFRQVPGTHYAWHEISIALQPAGNHKLVEDAMMHAIKDVYEKHQPILDKQQRSIEERFEVPLAPLRPRAQLHLSDSGLEAVVRYPVNLRNNVEADDEITRRLLELIANNKEMQTAVAGLPKIRAAVRG